jgi:hypothetical protein
MIAADKKTVEIAVMKEMRDLGILDHLNASFLSRSASVIRESEFDSLKPYKEIRTNEDDSIAAALVLSYLRKYGLYETVNCVQAEVDPPLAPASDAQIRNIGLGKNAGLEQMVKHWESHRTSILRRNVAELRNAFATRLDGIDNAPATPSVPSTPALRKPTKTT